MPHVAQPLESSPEHPEAGGSTGTHYLMSLCERREEAIRAPFTGTLDLRLDEPEPAPGKVDELIVEDFCDDPTIPPPGRRSGSGSWTILPYLVRTLAAKPKDPAEPDPAANDAARAADGAGHTVTTPR